MISQGRDLYTGIPVWEEYRRPRVSHHSLTCHVSADIVIIGSGISGAMLAEALSGQGLEIIVLDKRKPMTGSTSASTALLQYEIDEPLTLLSKKIGLQKASAAWRRSKLGLESLAVKIRELKIDCGFERQNSLYLTGNVLDLKAMEEEGRQRSAIGLHGKLVSKKELRDDFGIKGGGALLGWDNVACNPVQLTAGLLKASVDRGVTIYSPVEIERLERVKNDNVLTTTDGWKIKGRIVIFATGYEFLKFINTDKHKIQSTWAISTQPVKYLPHKMPFIWQASDPYNYGRTISDGRMIFGGEDEEFSSDKKRDTLIPSKTKKLLKKLHEFFPDLSFEIEHSWAGSFGTSTTGLPYIGRVPRHKDCYVVMAYGGNGITFSRIAAEIISSNILGYKDPDAKLFGFDSL